MQSITHTNPVFQTFSCQKITTQDLFFRNVLQSNPFKKTAAEIFTNFGCNLRGFSIVRKITAYLFNQLRKESSIFTNFHWIKSIFLKPTRN